MSRSELADAANKLIPEGDPDGPLSENDIGKIERGVVSYPHARRRKAMRMVLGAETDREIGLVNRRRRPTDVRSPVERGPAEGPSSDSDAKDVTIDRRSLLRGSVSGAALGLGSSAFVPGSPLPHHDTTTNIATYFHTPTGLLSAVADALVDSEPADFDGNVIDLIEMAKAVTTVRDLYQNGHYVVALKRLPALIGRARSAMYLNTFGIAMEKSAAYAAAVYQVASAVLLKFDDVVLAALAADRSVQAARNAGNPMIVGSSARAQVHSLLATRHIAAAVTLAVSTAHGLEREDASADESISIRGALILRAATAAARQESRAIAQDLLAEAEALGNQLGRDANVRWTAFGPTNVVLHRIAAAVDLGDAGTALALAATVNLDAVCLPERRAVLFIDSARAFLQWGKYEKCLDAIRTAEGHAPEEVRNRAVVHRLVEDLWHRSPPSIRNHVEQYARASGAIA
jgi:hypothetical protein